MLGIKVLSYNIRHARGMDDQVNLNRIAEVIGRSGAQLIGLQEVDKHLPRSHFCHQAKILSQRLHKFWAYGATLNWGVGQYGVATLSHWPIAFQRLIPLPSRGEQRGLLETEIQLGQRRINFFCTHLGLNREERQEQVGEIIRIVQESPNPSILVGDFNDERSSQEYRLITSVLQDATIDAKDFRTYPSLKPVEQIDFVFVSAHWQTLEVKTIHSSASDHLPVLVELRLAKPAVYLDHIKTLPQY